MHAWEAIQDTLKWIEKNLSESIEIDKLADIANLSPFYFQRLFNRLVGKPVMEYVKLRRLANASDYLAKHQRRIIDVALDYGFNNHETFSRAFKLTYGMTPEDYRTSPCQLSHFLMPDLSMNYQLVKENVPLVADGIVLEIRKLTLESPRYFAGLCIQNPMSDTPGVDYLSQQWDRLHTKKNTIPNLIPKGNEIGVSYPGELEGCFTYFSGAEVDHFTEQGDFTPWSLQVGEYVVCYFEAENFNLLTSNALMKARDYLFGVWLPNHQITTDLFMAELYFETSPEATVMEIWVKIKNNSSQKDSI